MAVAAKMTGRHRGSAASSAYFQSTEGSNVEETRLFTAESPPGKVALARGGGYGNELGLGLEEAGGAGWEVSLWPFYPFVMEHRTLRDNESRGREKRRRDGAGVSTEGPLGIGDEEPHSILLSYMSCKFPLSVSITV